MARLFWLALALFALALLGMGGAASPKPALATHAACPTTLDIYTWHRASGAADLADIDGLQLHFNNVKAGNSVWLDGLTLDGQDLTEASASSWTTLQSVGTFTDDATVKRDGSSSVRYDTSSGLGGISFRTPASLTGDWDLSPDAALSFWIRIEGNQTSGGQQQITNAVVPRLAAIQLLDSDTEYVQFAPQRQLPVNTWLYVTVPLADVSVCFSVSTQNSKTVPLQTTFSFSSIGPDAVQQYELDVDGDGTPEVSTSTPGTYQHTYTEPGVYEARLLATDAKGHTWSKVLEVAAAPPLDRPIQPRVLVVRYDETAGCDRNQSLLFAGKIKERFFQLSDGFVDIELVGVLGTTGDAPAHVGGPLNGNLNIEAMIAQFGLEQMLSDGDVTEIWIEQNSVGMAELYIVAPGPGGSPPFALEQLTACSVGTNFNTLHHFTHRAEYNIADAYGQYFDFSYDAGPRCGAARTPFMDFMRSNLSCPAENLPRGVGTSHPPCNSELPNPPPDANQHNNTTFVNCVVSAWANFPYNYPTGGYTSASTQPINCIPWNCRLSRYNFPLSEYGWEDYWFGNMPIAPGSLGSQRNTWWKYIFDFASYYEVGYYSLPTTRIASPQPGILAVAGGSGTADVTFSGFGHDPDSSIAPDTVAKLIWDFGDGGAQVEETVDVTAGSQSTLQHEFPPGQYTVQLLAEDEAGRGSSPTSSARVTVTVLGSLDSDGDGCTNAEEAGPEPMFGGQRDANNFWDFFDIWGHTDTWTRDGEIGLFIDIFGVVGRFGAEQDEPFANEFEARTAALIPPASTQGYHAAFDRAPPGLGDELWEMGPPDGTIDLFTDIFGVANQFGHECSGP